MDSDLQQYNGTADFPATANAGTNADPFLAPTDGPIVCADNNGINQGPVNKTLKRTKDLLLGLRDAIFGDRAGAQQYSIKSLTVDQTGGVSSGPPPGTIVVQGPVGMLGTAIGALFGDIVAAQGWLRGFSGMEVGTAGELAHLRAFCVAFLGTTTGITGANPPSNTATPNQLRALNTPKAWASFTSNGMAGAGVNIADAHAVASITKDATKFTITWATPFDSANYLVIPEVATTAADTTPFRAIVLGKTANSCDIGLFRYTGLSGTNVPIGTFLDPVNGTASNIIDVLAFGRQTT